MSAEEILILMINKGLIHVIGDEYFPTSVTDDLLLKNPEINVLSIEKPLKVDISNLYPEEIRLAAPSNKVEALMDYCNVPVTVSNGKGGFYTVRSDSDFIAKRVNSILSNPDINPVLLLKVIKDYYEKIDFPKSFKRFVDDELMVLYRSYEKGDEIVGDKPDNQKEM